MSPVYGGTVELQTRLPRQPNLPILPTSADQVLHYLSSLDRAIADLYGRLAERLQHFVEVVDTTPFGAADTVIVVTFGSALADNDYAILATPSWNTKIWITGIASGGFTINTSDAPGGGGGSVRWAAIR